MNENSMMDTFLTGYQLMSDGVQITLALCATLTLLGIIWFFKDLFRTVFRINWARKDARGALVASIYYSEDGELLIFEHENDKTPQWARDNVFNFPNDDIPNDNTPQDNTPQK
jgi:hypothetical protein